MKKIILLLIVIFSANYSSIVYCQDARNIDKTDSLFLINIPQLQVPAVYKSPHYLDLPDKHDNSELPYFRSIFEQYGYSCGQASSIGYNFTYEINRVRDLPASDSANMYAPLYTWNFFNDGLSDIGVNFYYSFEAIKANGQPNLIDFDGVMNNRLKWMSGYENYYNSMFNRISNVYSIYVGDMDGVETLKYWLYDRLNGSEHGSLANFYTDFSNYKPLPAGTPEEGKHAVVHWGAYTGHSMTIVGWNDSIRYDYNNDSLYTIDIDINGDGIVDMKDREIGGFKFVNSNNGYFFADSGFCYMMYKSIAEEKPPAGIWNKSVYVFDVKEDYQPLLTYKVKLRHTSRDKLKIVVGISSDTTDFWPEKELEFPIFNYQGGDNYMQGYPPGLESQTIEIGLDVTPLLSYVNADNPHKFFLKAIEKDPNYIGSGRILNFHLMDYLNEPIEIPCYDTNVQIIENGTTFMSIVHSINIEKVNINTAELPPLQSGEPYNFQMQADGGMEPYSWDLLMDYNENQQSHEYPDILGTILNDQLKPGSYVVQPIDFSFPFYGQYFDTIIIHTDGILVFDTLRLPIPYQVNDLIAYKLIKMIAPFLAQDLQLNQSIGNELLYEGNSEYAAFRWKESYKIENDYFPVDFTCILYKDGTIEYYYNSIELPDRANWLSGISNGDNTNFSISDYSKLLNSKSGNKVNYIPKNFCSEMKINNDGILTATAEDPERIFDLTVRVTDDSWISAKKSFQLSSGIIYDYSIHSGNDSQIDYGETAYINISVSNIGDHALNDINFSIQNSDSLINILDEIEIIGTLNPGETTIISDAFSFNVSDQIPNEYNFILQTSISSATSYWEGQMNFEAFAPELNLLTPIILEDLDGRPDPGDTVNIILQVSNFNGSSVENISGKVITSDPYISFIDSGLLFYGDLPTNSITNDTLTIIINEDAPNAQFVDFDITVNNTNLSLINETFQVLIGKFPVLIIDMEPSPTSADSVAFYCNKLNVPYHTTNNFESDLISYQSVLLCLGRKFSSYPLSDNDAEKLSTFLNNGGRLYMEGTATWHDDPQTIVHDMFNFEIDPLEWNLVDTIIGFPGSFAEDCFFNYYGTNPYYNYSLVPNDTAFPILKRYSKNHNLSVAYENETYKTIGSNINFGRLRVEPGDSSKIKLMNDMLVFLEVIDTTSTFVHNQSKLNSKNLFCYPNPVTNDLSIRFDVENKTPATLMLYNILGNTVSIILENKSFNKGTHTIQYNCAHLPDGVYICRLNSNNYTVCQKILIK